MNTQPLLVLDCHFLCHKAFYTMGGLSNKGKPTGVIFGFLKTISALKEEFQTDRIAFCFEHPHLLRKDRYSDYKKKRFQVERTEEEFKQLSAFREQIRLLREEYLPRIGFKNVFCFDGYEADDIMAAIAKYGNENETILVTADNDLLQCLYDNVIMTAGLNQKIWTHHKFKDVYGIRPGQWAVVKAIAGCKGDGVKGIKGIGEKTALKYLQGKLDERSNAYQKIRSDNGIATIIRNRGLVELPFEGCPVPDIEEDNISVKGWQSVCRELGFKSIAGHPPIHVRKQGLLKLDHIGRWK